MPAGREEGEVGVLSSAFDISIPATHDRGSMRASKPLPRVIRDVCRESGVDKDYSKGSFWNEGVGKCEAVVVLNAVSRSPWPKALPKSRANTAAHGSR
jgi:hypothetical protein